MSIGGEPKRSAEALSGLGTATITELVKEKDQELKYLGLNPYGADNEPSNDKEVIKQLIGSSRNRYGS